MPTNEKSYTFRAPEDLAPRAREAFRTWRVLLEDREVAGAGLEDAMAGFWLSLLRRARALEEHDSQSALFRATFELFVDATEKVAEDVGFVRAYQEWAAADEEGPAVRSGALEAAADRWRDE